MASKIFMGNMPELMEKILNNLNNELYSLYSCALVSRHWCKMSIPILWKDPFSFEQKTLFISKYFSSLDENEKLRLKESLRIYKINIEISETLFDYARFLKVLDLSRLGWRVTKWIFPEFVNFFRLEHRISLTTYIVNLLLKIFIESGANLHKLDLYFSDLLKIKPEIFCSLEQNEQFFSRLQDLSLSFISEFNTENSIKLLRILAKNATKINALKLNEIYSTYDQQPLNALIESQEQLRKFSLVGGNFPIEFYDIISALESQENSLQEVTIEKCVCSTVFKMLMNCKNLEILRIRNCENVEILEAKLKTFEITSCTINASNIVQILQKSGTLLQRLKLKSTGEESFLLEAIKSFCPNIIYLDLSYFKFSSQLLELIGNLKNLQFLTLWCMSYIPEELNMQIIQFAKTLPLTLQYLDFADFWLKPYIDILLNHCNVPLKKLIINHLDNERNVKALIEFCIRHKTLNYVSLDRFLSLEDNIRKEIEAYVTLVPYEHIVVNC
ncbi:hypothetical protein C2G38_2030305 [Gigaspora rosea]|uniref:F-box domain-containing protein n=1 Tax=Gigaspora rosea TaxID=44941 RepID=A0A397VX16_9GLOM|nr:hypothetical protein C2G38_2030305 [Gigaspora rosea]